MRVPILDCSEHNMGNIFPLEVLQRSVFGQELPVLDSDCRRLIGFASLSLENGTVFADVTSSDESWFKFNEYLVPSGKVATDGRIVQSCEFEFLFLNEEAFTPAARMVSTIFLREAQRLNMNKLWS